MALLSIVPVAWSLQLPPREGWQRVGWEPIDWPDALVLAACASLVAALAGGALGGLVRVHHRVTGALIALAIAWPVGIIVLPLAADAFGVWLRTGIQCIDRCQEYLSDAEPWGGPGTYATGAVWGVIAILPAVAALVLLVMAGIAGKYGGVVTGVVLAVLAYGALHFFSLLDGGAISFACLGFGVIAWSVWLDARDRRRGKVAADSQPRAARSDWTPRIWSDDR